MPRKVVLRKYGVTGQSRVKTFMKKEAFNQLTEEEKEAMVNEVIETKSFASIVARKYGVPGHALRNYMKNEKGLEVTKAQGGGMMVSKIYEREL